MTGIWHIFRIIAETGPDQFFQSEGDMHVLCEEWEKLDSKLVMEDSLIRMGPLCSRDEGKIALSLSPGRGRIFDIVLEGTCVHLSR